LTTWMTRVFLIFSLWVSLAGMSFAHAAHSETEPAMSHNASMVMSIDGCCHADDSAHEACQSVVKIRPSGIVLYNIRHNEPVEFDRTHQTLQRQADVAPDLRPPIF